MTALGIVKYGAVTIKILSNSETLTIAELHFPSGATAAIHHHINEEANYVAEGIFETENNSATKTYNVGEVIHVSSNQDHSLKCISKIDGKILTAWSPSRKDLIKKLNMYFK